MTNWTTGVRRLLACACLLCVLPASAERLVLTVAGADKHIYLPAVLADRLGYFRDEQLDVVFESELSGVSAADALLAGATQGVVGAYDHTIDLQARGKSVIAIVLFTIVPGEVELVSTRYAAGIRSPADFGGHPLGVTGIGSSTSFLTQYLALAHGVKPSALKLLPVGSGNSFVQAMRSGRIHAGMTTEPTASMLVAGGDAKILVDLRTPESTSRALGGLYPFACLYVRSDWLATHKEDAQKLAAALVKALRFINTHSAGEIAMRMPDSVVGPDRASYVQSLAHAKPMFTPDGVMPPEGPASVLRVLGSVNRDLRSKAIDLRQTFTTEFVSRVR